MWLPALVDSMGRVCAITEKRALRLAAFGVRENHFHERID